MKQKILVLSLAAIMLLGLTVNGTSALYSDTETARVSICTWYDNCTGYCAESVVEFEQGDRKDGDDVDEERSNPEEALLAPDGGCNPIRGFVSLGFGGEIILEFCQFVGGTITVTEITCSDPDYPLEKIEVWGSVNGEDWVLLGYADNTDNPVGSDSHQTEIELDENCCIKYVKLVDITDPADFDGYPNADGFDLDAVCGEPCEVGNSSMVIVSDTDTMVIEAGGDPVEPPQNAELACVHSNWSVIDYDFGDEPKDSRWIWETYRTDEPPAGDSAPEDGRVVRFERDFCIPCSPTSATLHITVDNGYTVWINGHLVGCAQVDPCTGWEATDLEEANLNSNGWETVEEYSTEGEYPAIDIAWLNKGGNTITILAGNEQMDGGNENSNPAGLIYELYIEYDDYCDYCCEED